MFFRCLSFCFATLIFVLGFSHDAAAQIEFDFPEAEVPVLRVDEYYKEANKDRRPMLLVYSDGRVVRPVSDVEADDYEFTLSETKFEKVLDNIFTTNEFTTISDEAILAEVSSPRRAKRPSPTSFRVTTNTSEGSHVVNFGNTWVHDRLGLGRKRHRDAQQLQRFLKVEEVCRELSNLALVGGEEAFQDTVQMANTSFKEAYPDGPEIGAANLFSVRRNDEGKVAIRFRVAKKVVDPNAVSVWITKTKGEAEESEELSVLVKIDKPLLLRDVHRRPPTRSK